MASPSRIAGLHLPPALGLFAIGVLHVLLEGLQPLSVLRAAFPMALGGFALLVVGTSRMLLAGTADVRLVAERVWWLPGLLVTVGSLGLYASFGGRLAWLRPSAIVWGLGLALHVSLAGASLARRRRRATVREGWPSAVATVATLGYGLASAVAVVSVAFELVGLFAALHLFLLGFVVLAVATVVLEVFPRFTGHGLPRAWAGPLAGALALGPALVAEGFEGSALLLNVGAVLEAAGLMSLGGGLVWLVARSDRGRRSFVLYAAAGAHLVVGALVGAGMAIGHLPHRLGAWHGGLNLLGFVGLVVIGAVMDLFAPALTPGSQSLELHERAVLAAALAGAVGLLAAPVVGDLVVRVALAAYLGALALHLLGSLARLRR